MGASDLMYKAEEKDDDAPPPFALDSPRGDEQVLAQEHTSNPVPHALYPPKKEATVLARGEEPNSVSHDNKPDASLRGQCANAPDEEKVKKPSGKTEKNKKRKKGLLAFEKDDDSS